MNNLEAIELRQSRRTYIDKPISANQLLQLNTYIDKVNSISGLSIQFVKNNKEAFKGFNPVYGMFSGVQNYFALIGKQSDVNLKEKAGYYGELLILEATKLGLGTCWVGATFNKNNCPCVINKDDSFICIITVGNITEQRGFKESLIYKTVHRGTKTLEEMYEADTPAPEWFLTGMRAVQKAPSAVNKQPVIFKLLNGKITAEVKDISSYQAIDLGIAKAHFEIGSGGSFRLGNGAEFTKE